MILEYVNLNQDNHKLIYLINQDESINKFIHLSDNYTNYVLNSENVIYKFLFYKNRIVGSLHIETYETTASFSIGILSKYQRQGFATKVIEDLKRNYFHVDVKSYVVYIEKSNIASINLFTKSRFLLEGDQEDSLRFVYHL